MICPRCQASLLRTERSGSVCSRCRRPFALDPKVHGRGMHDTRILHAVEKLTDKGRRQITVSQLRYLARSANPHWEATPESGRRPWIGRTVGAVLLAWLVALAVALRGVPSAGLIWWTSVAVSVVVYVVARGKRYRPGRRAAGHVEPSLRDFRAMICERWVQVYGSLPAGIVDDLTYQETREATHNGGRRGGKSVAETVTLLCPDRAVRVFLSVNGFPRRLNLTLAGKLDEVPPSGPVVVLHDASVDGFQLVADARASLPRRAVVDAGLPVRAVLGNRGAVRLHETPVMLWREHPDWLKRMEQRAPEDAAWLTRGWLSPVAAVPPALLESAVVRAVQNARSAPDTERRQAAAVGFLSRPQPSEPPVKDGN